MKADKQTYNQPNKTGTTGTTAGSNLNKGAQGGAGTPQGKQTWGGQGQNQGNKPMQPNQKPGADLNKGKGTTDTRRDK